MPRWGPDTGRERLERMRPARVALLQQAITQVLQGGPEMPGRLPSAIRGLAGWSGGLPDAQDVAAVWRGMERAGTVRTYRDSGRRNHPLMLELPGAAAGVLLPQTGRSEEPLVLIRDRELVADIQALAALVDANRLDLVTELRGAVVSQLEYIRSKLAEAEV